MRKLYLLNIHKLMHQLFDFNTKKGVTKVKHSASFYLRWKQLEVIQIKLFDTVRSSIHFKHIGWVHFAQNCSAEVLCKLFAVNGR